jgi:cation:H+ antiporter
VAFGTGAPELAVSVGASAAGRTELALANVVGSNVFNVLFILGACALARPLVVHRQLVRLEVPIVIAASVLLVVFALDGRVSRLEGAFLAGCMGAYTVWAVRRSRMETRALQQDPGPQVRMGGLPERPPVLRLVADAAAGVAGLALLVLGARWVVGGATQAAVALGVSDVVIGLTIVAAGTSLPEVATSLVATFRGERDIAVGNVVGSNLFNILGVAGLSALFGASDLSAGHGLLSFDLPVMAAAAMACLPILWTGYSIDRWEGALFVGLYVAYTIYLILRAAEHDALAPFSAVLGWFVLPLVVATLATIGVRERRRGPSRPGTQNP